MNDEQRLEWLVSEIGRNQTYHARKETTAWLATVFYISGMVTTWFAKPVLTLPWWFVAITAAFVGAFLYAQFENRRLSSRRLTGLIRVFGEDGQHLNNLDWPLGAEEYLKCIVSRMSKDKCWSRERVGMEYVVYGAIALSAILALIPRGS